MKKEQVITLKMKNVYEAMRFIDELSKSGYKPQIIKKKYDIFGYDKEIIFTLTVKG